MTNILRDPKGMTLVEVVVGAALITLMILALIATLSQGSVFSKRLERTYTASNLAEMRIDTLRKLDFAQIPQSTEVDIRVGKDGNMDASGQYYRTTAVVENYDGNQYLTKVTVTVKKIKVNMDGSILDDQGEATFLGQAITMETLLADVD